MRAAANGGWDCGQGDLPGVRMNLQRRAGVEGEMTAADGDRSSWWWFLDTRVATGAWQQVGRPRWWNAAPQRAKNCQWARLQLTTNGADGRWQLAATQRVQ